MQLKFALNSVFFIPCDCLNVLVAHAFFLESKIKHSSRTLLHTHLDLAPTDVQS